MAAFSSPLNLLLPDFARPEPLSPPRNRRGCA